MNRKMRITFITIIQTAMLVILMTVPALAIDNGMVSGSVYHDSNGNAQPELGEVNIANATVYVQRQGDDAPVVVTADVEGYFVLADLPYGAYRVWAEDAQHNMSSVQIVELNEVTGAISIELPIVYDLSNDVQMVSVSNLFLPFVNR